MTKFSVGDWVYHEEDNQTGLVTANRPDTRSVNVRWIGKSKAGQKTYSAASLQATTPRPFFLEGNLNSDLGDFSRTEQNLLRTWLSANEFQLAFKNVHQLSDIELLANMIGKLHPPFIHISCHGAVHPTKGPCIQFLDGQDIYLNDPETIRVFSLFEGYPVFFSACLLGATPSHMTAFRNAANLGPIAASSREIYDHEAMLFGLMLYQCTLINGLPFETAVDKSLKACKLLGIKGKQGNGQSFVRLFN